MKKRNFKKLLKRGKALIKLLEGIQRDSEPVEPPKIVVWQNAVVFWRENGQWKCSYGDYVEGESSCGEGESMNEALLALRISDNRPDAFGEEDGTTLEKLPQSSEDGTTRTEEVEVCMGGGTSNDILESP